MWNSKYKYSKGYDGLIHEYILENKVACKISFVKNRVARPEAWEKTYRGVVYKEDVFPFEHNGAVMYNKDLDVLKLMCLLRAKEVGWNIKEIG